MAAQQTELYECLYALNAGAEEMLRALARMREAGLLVPFVTGNIQIIQALQWWVRFGVIGIMSDCERAEWEAYESARSAGSPASGASRGPLARG